jgi:hypothetical protein
MTAAPLARSAGSFTTVEIELAAGAQKVDSTIVQLDPVKPIRRERMKCAKAKACGLNHVDSPSLRLAARVELTQWKCLGGHPRIARKRTGQPAGRMLSPALINQR